MNSTLRTTDGLTLRLHLWEGPQPRGQVLIVHGLGEHGARHAPLAAALHGHGWRVMAYDQRGHGESDGERGVIPQDDSLLSDLAQVIDLARASADVPLVLLGHSMGGLVAGRFVAEGLQARAAPWSRPVDALVMSSPALSVAATPLQRLLLAVVPTLWPRLTVGNGLDPSWVSRDPAIVQAYLRDPLVHDRISAALGRFIAQAGPQTLALAPRWRVPTLLMWAGADRCVQAAGSARFAQLAPAGTVSAREWPGLSHEIFNEPEHAEVWAALLAWLDPRLPPGV